MTKMGAPPKAKGTHHKQVTVSLPPDLREWLRTHPEGQSALITRLLRAEEAKNA